MKTIAVTAGETFAVLFPLVDPIGNAPTFVALTSGLSPPSGSPSSAPSSSSLPARSSGLR